MFASSLYAENIPGGSLTVDELNQLLLDIDFEASKHLLFTEKNGEFVAIDKHRKAAFYPIEDLPYGFVDDMTDLVSTYNAEEATNVDKARATLTAIKDGAKFVQKFDGKSLVDLPIGMEQKFDDTDVIIGISSVRVYPSYTALEVFVELNRKDWPTSLIFYAPEIKFSQKGGLKGPSKVGLLGNMVLPVEEGKSKLVLRRASYDPTLKVFTEGTFLQFDCDGFQSLGIDADLVLSREWVVPYIPSQNVINPNGRVKGNFTTEITDITDMVFEISLNDFVIPQCDRLGWNIDQAVFDFSETKKLFDFPIPNLPYNPIENGFLVDQESWKGIKIDEISCRWLDTIAQNTQTSFPGLSGQSIVIDHNGFSGIVEVTGLLPMDVGKMDGWDFSVDLLGVQILQNQASGFEFQGGIVVPILEKDEESNVDTIFSALSYGASFDFTEREYAMFVGIESPMSFDMKVFKGQGTILPDSQLKIEYREDDGYGVEAVLNGAYSMGEKVIFGKKVSIPTVQFQNLTLASQKKYVRKVGTWGIPLANGKFMGITYNVGSMGVDTLNGNPLIKIAANLNFAQKDGVQISAASAFTVEGEIVEENNAQKYKWNTININLIQIEADLESVYFFGEIILFKEFPIWGTGFQGKVELYVKGGNAGDESTGSGFGAMALFGTTDNDQGEEYRYFLIDVMLRLDKGIEIPQTGMAIFGAGGGVYYHMNQLSITQTIEDVAYDPGDPNNIDAYTQYIMDRIGKSLSGTEYLPDDSKLLGINMNMVIGLASKPEVFNANIGFTIQINSSYGIDFIRLKGITNFMSEMAWNGPSVVGFSAVTELNLIFPGEDPYLPPGFYGESHLFVRVSAQVNNFTIDALVGAHEFNDVPPYFQTVFQNAGVPSNLVKYAGVIESQINAFDWFINAGTPSSRLALRSNVLIATLELGAYVDVGTNIPPAPPLPPDIAAQLNWTPIPEPARATGNGFAFGANFGLTIGGDYTLFAAILDIQAGFDLMLQQYEPVYCDDNPLGVFFFYAGGQAYASVHGEVSGFGYVLFDVAAAVAMSFKAPNPTYAKGAVSGYYNVGFGAYQGHCYYPFEIGEQCKTDEEIEVEINLIADLFPDENGVAVSTDASMIGATYFPINEETTIVDEDGNEIPYQLELETFELLQDGIPVEGSMTLDAYTLRFISEELLEEQTDYTLTFELNLRNLSTNEIEFSESKIHFFTTGEHSSIISPDNVESTWPQDGQFNYYKSTGANGTVKLKRGQDHLFQSSDTQYAKITSSYPSAEVYSPVTYNYNTNTLSYSIPANLLNGQAYRVQIISVPSSSPGQIGGMAEPLSTTLSYPGGNNLPELSSDHSVLFTYYFRKSKFDDPLEKYESMTYGNMIENVIEIDGLQEPFGKEELVGINGKPKTFEAIIDLEQTPFYDQYANYETPDGIIHPYENNSGRSDYSIAVKDNLSDQRIQKYGLGEPDLAIDLYQNESNYYTTATNLDSINLLNQQNQVYGLNDLDFYMVYKLDSVAYGDIKYFIESTFNSGGYENFIATMYDLPYGDCQAGSMTACCLSSETYRNELGNLYQGFLANENDVFQGVYQLFNDQPSCENNPIYVLSNQPKGFLRTTVQYYPLENGTYPIHMQYTQPINQVQVKSESIPISRNSGSD